MKKFITLATILVLLISCGRNDRGELVGVRGKKWYPERPYGMVLVPNGSFIMGKSDDDLFNVNDAPPRTVTVGSYYMDQTEITNAEYRQYVVWVRDSIVRLKLAEFADEMGIGPGDGGIGAYAFLDQDESRRTPFEQYMFDNYYSFSDDFNEGRVINKRAKLIWDTSKYPDEFYAEVMDSMYIPYEEAYNGERTIDVQQLKFRYTTIDIEAAAKAHQDPTKRRRDFIKTEDILIYPDTTVWIRDFNYAYNEPMHNDYFWHDAYSKYPVVGVSWKQASAFAEWRTLHKNSYRKSKGQAHISRFRLPSEAEWEYAARGGLESATYPWGGPYTIDDRGCFLANFKPARGDYAADGALYTVEAKSYSPNGYGLYNMAGNVAEWTNSSYDQSSYAYSATMNPNVNDLSNPKKVVRGGSWKDTAYFLQVSTRDYEYADSARSYIGFRTIQDHRE